MLLRIFPNNPKNIYDKRIILQKIIPEKNNTKNVMK